MRKEGGLVIPIRDYCWQGFSLELRAHLTVGDLVDLAERSDPELCLVHDEAQNSSVVVIPELVLAVAEELPNMNVGAEETGLLGEIREGQMIVGADEPAIDVARAIDLGSVSVLIAVDAERRPSGLLFTDVVARRLHSHAPEIEALSGRSGLADRVAAASGRGQLVVAFDAIEEGVGAFHSEALNSWNPDPLVCWDHGRSHLVSRCPCEFHPGAECTARQTR